MRNEALTTLLADFERFIKEQDLTPPNTRSHLVRWVKAFLTRLAMVDKVSASTQNQAFNALLLLFREVLRSDLADISHVVREFKTKARSPLDEIELSGRSYRT